MWSKIDRFWKLFKNLIKYVDDSDLINTLLRYFLVKKWLAVRLNSWSSEWSPFLFWLLPTPALPVLWSFRAFEELYQCIQEVFAPRCFIYWSGPDPWTDLHPLVLCFSCCAFWGSLMISSFFNSIPLCQLFSFPFLVTCKYIFFLKWPKWERYNHKEVIIFSCGLSHFFYHIH